MTAKPTTLFDAWEKGDLCLVQCDLDSDTTSWKTVVFLGMSDTGLVMAMESDHKPGEKWDGKTIPLPQLFQPDQVKPLTNLAFFAHTSGWPASEKRDLQSRIIRMNAAWINPETAKPAPF